jgi:hypothetical protein
MTMSKIHTNKTMNKTCKNCIHPHNQRDSSFCSQSCFDEWVAKLIGISISEAVYRQSMQQNELTTVLLNSQLKRDM